MPDEEKIYENVNDDDPSFSCPDGFVPVFVDEALASMDANLSAEATRICGNDPTCIFDIAATKQPAIGESTLQEITTINNEIAEVGTYLVTYSIKNDNFKCVWKRR